nr:MAG TPA: hypothetical protein [Caudoviricetes sp.]
MYHSVLISKFYRGAFYLLIVCQFTHPPLIVSYKLGIYFHLIQ